MEASPACSRCGATKVENGGTEARLYRRKTDGEVLCYDHIEDEYRGIQAEKAIKRREWFGKIKAVLARKK